MLKSKEKKCSDNVKNKILDQWKMDFILKIKLF